MLKVLAMISYLVTHSSYAPVEELKAKEVFCMATAVYHEARGEPVIGQVAVAYTIKNRVGRDQFPPTICGVVYDEKHAVQFPDVKKVRPDYKSAEWNSAVEIATLTMVRYVEDPTRGARYYYNPKKVKRPKWARMRNVQTIGDHTFFNHAPELNRGSYAEAQ